MVASSICDLQGVALMQPVCDCEIEKSKKKCDMGKSLGQECVERSSKFHSSVQAEAQLGFECIGGVAKGMDPSGGAAVKGREVRDGVATSPSELSTRHREAEQARLLALVRASLRSPSPADLEGSIEHGGGGGWRAVLLASADSLKGLGASVALGCWDGRPATSAFWSAVAPVGDGDAMSGSGGRGIRASCSAASRFAPSA